MNAWVWLPIVIMFVLFFLKVPVSYAMVIAAATYFLFGEGSMNIATIIQKMQASQESFVYLAIPFFTCAGVVFNYCGITRRLMNLAELLVGHLTGGLGHVNCVLSALMGGLSGSANADAAMETKMLVPEMERLGYGRAFSCAVTAASSCITPIIPPGIILILYATASDASVAKMFYAGYIPGIIMMVALMTVVYIVSKRRGYKPSRQKPGSIKEIGKALKEAFWALLIPFAILGGLRFGLFTPTEAGAICILYAVIVGAFIYKELKWKHVIPIILESVAATAGIMFILAGANAFSAYLTWESLPQKVSAIVASICSQPWQFLLLCNILLLFIGMFFDGGAAMILCAPLLVPAAKAFGIDLIHFGIVMCINLTMAGFTPPFGAMMFVTTSIANVKIQDYTREALPFVLVLFIVLLLLTFIPGIVLLGPRLLG
ncbi:MAG: TRAP transporter large permease [Clostridiales bacterium]|nr:TRAP transporter large permease [Clostridiales bacterium]